MHQLYQDQFLLLPNFLHITLEEFEGIESIQFSKIMIFVFHPTHHQIIQSSQITKADFTPTMSRSIPFAPKPFPHHFGGICEVWVQPLFKIMIFVFQPTHHQVTKSTQIHQTWLCNNNTKINFFCSQTFSISLRKHLSGLSPPSFQKSWFSFLTLHTTKSQNLANTPKSPNLT